MDDVLVFVEFERVQDLNGEAADEAHADPSELGVFDEFVKVDAQKLEDEADVRAKNEVIFDLDNIGCVFGVQVGDVLENLAFDVGLVLEFFLVLDYLDSNEFVLFMVVAFQGLAERAFPQQIDDFVTISDLVFHYGSVIAFIVVIAKILLVEGRAFEFNGFFSDVVNLPIIKNFAFLKICQLVHEELQGFPRANRVLWLHSDICLAALRVSKDGLIGSPRILR